jgi:hypothetical protein
LNRLHDHRGSTNIRSTRSWATTNVSSSRSPNWGGRLAGIGTKADSAPSGGSVRDLAALRDRCPDAFVAGSVLRAGPRTYRLGDRLLAALVSTLWS